jgi:hypothetical protein
MQPPEQGEEEEEIAEEVSHNPEPPEEAEEEPQSTISPALLLRNLRILIPSRANSVPEPKDDEPAESPRDHPVTTADREVLLLCGSKVIATFVFSWELPPSLFVECIFPFFFVPLVAEEEQDQAYLYTSLLRFLPALH